MHPWWRGRCQSCNQVPATRDMGPDGLFVSQRTGSHSAGISCTIHELFCLSVLLCGTWSETSVAPSQLTQFWQMPRIQNAFLFIVNAIFRHDYPLAVEPASTPRPLERKKKTWRDALSINMLLSAVSVLVVAQSSSEIPEGLMNNPVYLHFKTNWKENVPTGERRNTQGGLGAPRPTESRCTE